MENNSVISCLSTSPSPARIPDTVDGCVRAVKYLFSLTALACVAIDIQKGVTNKWCEGRQISSGSNTILTLPAFLCAMMVVTHYIAIKVRIKISADHNAARDSSYDPEAQLKKSPNCLLSGVRHIAVGANAISGRIDQGMAKAWRLIHCNRTNVESTIAHSNEVEIPEMELKQNPLTEAANSLPTEAIPPQSKIDTSSVDQKNDSPDSPANANEYVGGDLKAGKLPGSEQIAQNQNVQSSLEPHYRKIRKYFILSAIVCMITLFPLISINNKC